EKHRMTVGLYHTKTNHGPLRTPLGFRLTWEPEALTIARADVRDVPELARNVPLVFRIVRALRAGPRSLADLAVECEADREVIRKTVDRHKSKFTRLGDHRLANATAAEEP